MELLFERFLSEERGESARHRPRPPLGRRAGEGHPARLRDVRRPRRGDDGEHDHLPRPLRRARDGQGARLLGRAGRFPRSRRGSRRGASGSTGTRPDRSRHGRRATETRRRRRRPGPPLSPKERRHLPPSRRRWPRRCAGLRPTRKTVERAAPALRLALAASRTSRDTSGSTRAGWSSREGSSTRSSRSSRAVDARPRRAPVGQGRLRRPRPHQDRPARARHDRRSSPDASGRPRRAKACCRPRPPPARRRGRLTRS